MLHAMELLPVIRDESGNSSSFSIISREEGKTRNHSADNASVKLRKESLQSSLNSEIVPSKKLLKKLKEYTIYTSRFVSNSSGSGNKLHAGPHLQYGNKSMGYKSAKDKTLTYSPTGSKNSNSAINLNVSRIKPFEKVSGILKNPMLTGTNSLLTSTIKGGNSIRTGSSHSMNSMISQGEKAHQNSSKSETSFYPNSVGGKTPIYSPITDLILGSSIEMASSIGTMGSHSVDSYFRPQNKKLQTNLPDAAEIQMQAGSKKDLDPSAKDETENSVQNQMRRPQYDGHQTNGEMHAGVQTEALKAQTTRVQTEAQMHSQVDQSLQKEVLKNQTQAIGAQAHVPPENPSYPVQQHVPPENPSHPVQQHVPPENPSHPVQQHAPSSQTATPVQGPNPIANTQDVPTSWASGSNAAPPPVQSAWMSQEQTAPTAGPVARAQTAATDKTFPSVSSAIKLENGIEKTMQGSLTMPLSPIKKSKNSEDTIQQPVAPRARIQIIFNRLFATVQSSLTKFRNFFRRNSSRLSTMEDPDLRMRMRRTVQKIPKKAPSKAQKPMAPRARIQIIFNRLFATVHSSLTKFRNFFRRNSARFSTIEDPANIYSKPLSYRNVLALALETPQDPLYAKKRTRWFHPSDPKSFDKKPLILGGLRKVALIPSSNHKIETDGMRVARRSISRLSDRDFINA
jgi:hypothetical protein